MRHDTAFVGWRDIADALGVSVRTAHRWERDHHLPIERDMSAGGPIQPTLRLTALAQWLNAADMQRDAHVVWIRRARRLLVALADYCEARGDRRLASAIQSILDL